MQCIGYLFINNEKILVLVRHGENCRYLTRRYSGKDGNHFKDEEIYLNLKVESVELNKQNLLKGNTIVL